MIVLEKMQMVKKEMFIGEISIIILICQKLGSVGPLQ